MPFRSIMIAFYCVMCIVCAVCCWLVGF